MKKSNLSIIKRKYPSLLTKLSKVNVDKSKYHVEQARKQGFTLVVEEDGTRHYLHSKYDPIREAKAIIDKYTKIDEYEHIIFLGVGLGYHVDVFQERYPKTKFSMVFFEKDIAYQLFSRVDLNSKNYRNLQHLFILESAEEINRFCVDLISMMTRKTLIVKLPVYEQVFPREIETIQLRLKAHAESRRSNLRVNKAYEKAWILNSLINFSTTLQTPNFLHDVATSIQGKPAIIVAAGPSLEFEIENIRKIVEEQSAYVFAVGSAINSLLHHGIEPHAMITYDPSVLNINVYRSVTAKNECDIPMIYGTSVAEDVLRAYNGPKIHMTINQDFVSKYFLKRKDEQEVKFLDDAPSISIVAMMALLEVQADPIIFVGQNMALLNESLYAEGIQYDHIDSKVDMRLAEGYFEVESVDGGTVTTKSNLHYIKKYLDVYLTQNEIGSKVYNTTKGGAVINGTEYKHLDKIMEDVLHKNAISEDWNNVTRNQYDFVFLKEQQLSLQDDFIAFEKALSNVEEMLKDLNVAYENRQERKIQLIMSDFDSKIRLIESNRFYKTIILPMNRVLIDILIKSIREIKQETDIFRRTNRIVREYSNFVYCCSSDYFKYKPFFEMFFRSVDSVLKAKLPEHKRKIVAIIPARSGSKGLPGKNTMKISGKPLIAYTIEAAINSKYINKVIVSTDSVEIAEISKRYGAEVPELRPRKLAEDDSSVIDALKYHLDEIGKRGDAFQDIVLLQPTSPLRTTEDIDKGIELYDECNAESVISVYEMKKSIRLVRTIDKGGWLKKVVSQEDDVRNRQQYERNYYLNGALYITSVENLLETGTFDSDKTVPYIMDEEQSVDIDTEEDFKRAEEIMRARS